MGNENEAEIKQENEESPENA